MRNTINHAITKLNSRAGETISETLVSLLIAALALVMLAGSISAASAIIRNSRTRLDSYYDKSNILAEMTGAENTKSATVTILNNGSNVFGGATGKTVTCYENDEFTRSKVIAYKKNNI